MDLPLRDPALITLSTIPALSLLTLRFGDIQQPSPGGAATRTLTVIGLAPGLATVAVSLGTPTATASAQGAVAAGGAFSVPLSLPAAALADFVLVEVRDTGTTGLADRSVVRPGLQTEAVLPEATLANFDRDRLSYLAGTPDRVIPSRTFVQFHGTGNGGLLRDLPEFYIGRLKGTLRRIDEVLKGTFRKSLARQHKALTEGQIDVDAFYIELEQQLLGLLQTEAGPLKDTDAKRVQSDMRKAVTDLLAARSDQIAKSLVGTANPAAPTAPTEDSFKPNVLRLAATAATASATPSAAALAAPKSVVWLRSGSDTDIKDYTRQLIKGYRGSQRLGVLFSDELRISPVGLVVGEPLYKLSLSPGEEVQLHQSSETRKRVALSEIKDRESESNLTLSSTLSTDLSATVSDTRSFQSQVSLGGGLSGTIPQTPIGVSVDAGTNTTSAHNNSLSQTVSFHNETTSTSMAKLRAQHKTTLEVSTDETSGYTTTRTLRNTNLQRSQIHTFYKLYRKEKLSLERKDAQLCVRLELLDPALESRASFLTSFHRLDPNNPENWELPEFGDVLLKKSARSFTAPADQEAWAAFGGTHDRWRTFTELDVATFLGAPSGYHLIDRPKLVMTEVETFTSNSDLAGVEGSRTGSGTLTRNGDMPPGVQVQQDFLTAGGKVRDVKWPQPLGDDMRLELDVSFAFKMRGRPPVVPFIELQQEITSVTFEISATFGPTGAKLQERQDRLLRRKREAAEAFAPLSVYALAEAVRAQYPGNVINRAIRENFRTLSLDRLAMLGRIFDLDKTLIENAPFWASEPASETHAQLKLLLERLPKWVDSNAILTPELTGALAIVYLPIRHGMESEGLALLDELEAAERAALLVDFNRLRDQKFGLLRPAAGLAQPDTPLRPRGTEEGAASWGGAWETAMRRSEVLAEWSDLTPTDGLHVETQLSATSVADENGRARLQRLD